MNHAKYIGLDVHQATISVAIRDAAGKLMAEAIIETKADTILEFFDGLRGSLHVALEEGTWSAWLHDLLQPHVTQVLVCDSRKNPSMKRGNRSDRLDARKLARLLYLMSSPRSTTKTPDYARSGNWRAAIWRSPRISPG
jgi:transposase